MLKNGVKRMKEEERILGIDFGEKRVGIAISDPLCMIAMPLETIERKKIEEGINKILERFPVKHIVIGYPLRTNGKKGKRAEQVEKFAKKIKGKFNIEITLWDERYSTVEAERIMKDMNRKPSREKERVDRIAASLILQSYLDSLGEKE